MKPRQDRDNNKCKKVVKVRPFFNKVNKKRATAIDIAIKREMLTKSFLFPQAGCGNLNNAMLFR